MKTQRKGRVSGRKPAPSVADPPAPRHETIAAAAVLTDGAGAGRRLSPRARAAISLLLLFHLGAVVVAALRVPPVSELALNLAMGVRWYTEPLLVNPGYRFFAPDPGESHMIRAEIVAADGSKLEEVYPDLRHEWPRLLYHRHFMLTSRLDRAPADPLSQALADSYARHLFAQHDAREVQIVRRVHLLPTRDQVLRGLPLTDESFYAAPYDSPVGTWTTQTNGSFDATKLELQVNDDRTATLTGRLRGQMVKSSWTWQAGSPPGPRRLTFFEDSSDVPACTADSPEEHELVLHYPLPGSGVSRVGSIEHVPMRRTPPPLAVYRGEQP